MTTRRMSGRPTSFMVAAACAVFAALCATALGADRWVPDNDACNQQPNTIAIVDCLGQRINLWDGRLNGAWRAATTMLQDPASKPSADALRAAQRAWLNYRFLNCGYYAHDTGTIRQIEVAMCMRDMTQARAIELQAIGPQ